MNTDLLDLAEVARRLQVSLALLYQLIVNGEIRAVRIGSRLWVRLKDLEEYMQQTREPR